MSFVLIAVSVPFCVCLTGKSIIINAVTAVELGASMSGLKFVVRKFE